VLPTGLLFPPITDHRSERIFGMDEQKLTTRAAPSHGIRFKLVAVGVAISCVAAAAAFLIAPRTPHSTGQEIGPAAITLENQAPPSPRLFRNWPTPDVAIVLSGQEYGYLQPCGCSEPQKGGLARRFNFLKMLREERKWPIVAGDLGDVAQKGGPQAKLKYVVSMQARQKLGYTAVGVGENEGAIPLFEALGEFALNNPKPRVLATNLQNGGNFPGAETWEVSADTPLRVGFVCIVGPTVAQAMTGQDSSVKFDSAEKVLPTVIDEMQKKGRADLLVLLYQGYDDEAKNLLKQFPKFNVVLHLIKEEEPPGEPQSVGDTLLVGIGHKGRYIGVVGVNRTNDPAKPFELRYQLVPLDPEYETPENRDADNPIHALLQGYANTLKAENYLSKFPQQSKHPVQIQFPGAEYIGSESCEACHKEAYQIWANSPHPHAYDTLVNKAKRPTLRQFDGECVECHVTGFTYTSGFSASNPAQELMGVTCENCHGPCSLHKKKPHDVNIQKAINPWKYRVKNDPKALLLQIDSMCQKCHDSDNDVHFKFEDYWEPKKIAHYTPKKEQETQKKN
jgi:hypothetical protein